MSLSTIIKIGHELRKSENSLRYFKYTEPCPVSRDDNPLMVFNLPVHKEFTIDWQSLSIADTSEQADTGQKDYYFLRYTLSDNDSSPKKYLFGDIYYTRKSTLDTSGNTKNIREFGNYTFERGNAFNNGLNAYANIKEELLWKKVVEKVNLDVKENNREPIAKIIYKKVISKDPTDIPLRFAKKYTDYIELTASLIKEYGNNHPFIAFHTMVEKDLEKINRLLLYAPVVKDFPDKLMILSDISLLQQEYIAYLKNAGLLTRVNHLLKDTTINNEQISRLMQYGDHSLYLHFDFKDSPSGPQWYHQADAFDVIKKNLINETTQLTSHGLVPSKSIYRTLCSGNDKNDIQFPGFNNEKKYRSFSFRDSEQFTDFLYSGSIVNKPFRRIYATSIDQYIIPRAHDSEVTASQYDLFFNNSSNYDICHEPLFAFLLNPAIDYFPYYDIILSDAGGNTVTDRILLNGISLLHLKKYHERISAINHRTHLEKAAYYYTDEVDSTTNNLKIENSFRKLLSNIFLESTGKIKYNPVNRYQSHLLKVLPQIYTGTYFRDDILLHHFIEKMEFIIRNMDVKDCWYHFTDLKFHLIFLFRIQNTEIDKYMQIIRSESYRIGYLLGDMAKKLSIDHYSFERTHLANLSRNITTLTEFVKFKNSIEQKLLKYRKTHFIHSAAYELTQLLKEFSEEYDKDTCAFGFLEAYFKPFSRKKDPNDKNY